MSDFAQPASAERIENVAVALNARGFSAGIRRRRLGGMRRRSAAVLRVATDRRPRLELLGQHVQRTEQLRGAPLPQAVEGALQRRDSPAGVFLDDLSVPVGHAEDSPAAVVLVLAALKQARAAE